MFEKKDNKLNNNRLIRFQVGFKIGFKLGFKVLGLHPFVGLGRKDARLQSLCRVSNLLLGFVSVILI